MHGSLPVPWKEEVESDRYSSFMLPVRSGGCNGSAISFLQGPGVMRDVTGPTSGSGIRHQDNHENAQRSTRQISIIASHSEAAASVNFSDCLEHGFAQAEPLASPEKSAKRYDIKCLLPVKRQAERLTATRRPCLFDPTTHYKQSVFG